MTQLTCKPSLFRPGGPILLLALATLGSPALAMPARPQPAAAQPDPVAASLLHLQQAVDSLRETLNESERDLAALEARFDGADLARSPEVDLWRLAQADLDAAMARVDEALERRQVQEIMAEVAALEPLAARLEEVRPAAEDSLNAAVIQRGRAKLAEMRAGSAQVRQTLETAEARLAADNLPEPASFPPFRASLETLEESLNRLQAALEAENLQALNAVLRDLTALLATVDQRSEPAMAAFTALLENRGAAGQEAPRPAQA